MDKQLQTTQFLLYKAENGKIKVDVLIQDETVVCANFAHTTKHGAIENKTQTTT